MSSIASRPAATVARFVAYDRNPVRVGNPEDGTAMSVRSETFVEEYASIRIAEFKPKNSAGDFATLYVKFDAASTGAQGMQHDFGASAEPDGPLAERLQHAYETGTPIYVAIETRRRKHVEGKRDEPIDVHTPIHALRGATGESQSGQPQVTKANCVKVIVAAGSVDDPADTAIASAKDLRSDIGEWTQLRGNKLGDLPPEGWRCLVRDGKRTGGITNIAAPTSGGADVAAIADAVAGRLGQPKAAAKSTTATVVRGRPGQVTEAKVWEPINSDGRPNMGSYLAAKIRATHQSAVYLFGDALDGIDPDSLPEMTEQESLDHVWQLTNLLLWLADKVQHKVVGAANRNETSHKEAGQWIQQTIATRFPYAVEYIVDGDARREWSLSVLAAATEGFERTQQMMAEYLHIELPAAEEPAPQQQSTEATAAGTEPQPEQPADPPQSVPQQTEPAATPEPAQPRPLTAGEDPAAVAAWKALADACDMTNHIDNLRFVLKSTFNVNTGVLGEIEATTFTGRVAQWATDPQRFRTIAEQAYMADPENRKAS